MVMPTAQDVADFLGRGDDTTVVAAAGETLPIITAMARSYTRDRGFDSGDPADDVAAVLVTATARLMTNPEQIAHTAGAVTLNGKGFTAWSLAETFVLNRYRKTAL